MHVTRGSRHMTVTFVVLLLSVNSCWGFNELFKLHDTFVNTRADHVELQLPTSQDGLLFQPRQLFSVYGKTIEKFTVYKNGLVSLDDQAVQSIPRNYPENTHSTGKRLTDFDGYFLSVFSTVNDGPFGTMTVGEISITDPLALDCLNAKQIERFQKLIHLRNPSDQNFAIQTVLSFVWENMTNSQYQTSKSNSYSLMLLTNGTVTYAVLQYWKIEWPPNGISVSNSLPPEAGVFIKELAEGFQLPRSGYSVNTSLWTTESNVAVPGEWLIPLYETENDADPTLEGLPRVIEDFITSLRTACSDEYDHLIHENAIDLVKPMVGPRNASNVMNDLPPLPEHELSTDSTNEERDNYTDESDEDYDYDQEPGADSFWSGYEEAMGKQVNEPQSTSVETQPYTWETATEPSVEPWIIPETALPLGTYDGDEERMYTVEPTIVPKTVFPLGEGFTAAHFDYRDYTEGHAATDMARAYVAPTHYAERCNPTSECAVPNSDCYRVRELACCVCPAGSYGSGNKQCFPEDHEYNFAFRGNLKATLNQGQASVQFPVYLDIQNGRSKRSSSGVRNGYSTDPNFQIVHLLTPMFHVFNALIATTCQNESMGNERVRPYNVFSLTGALRSKFNLRFHFDIEHVGKIIATATFRLDLDSGPTYARGSMDVQVTAPEGVSSISRTYREVSNGAGLADRTYYTSYRLDPHGRVVFPEQAVTFVAETRGTTDLEAQMDELMVRWSAIGSASPMTEDDHLGGCLLQPEGPVARDQVNYIKMLDRGYCSADCSAPDGSCNLFCVDVPLLSATEPDACTCVKCSGRGEYCKPDGTTYSCECQPGLRRMEDRTCRANAQSPDIAKPKFPCGPNLCHPEARCIEPQSGICQCLPGYRGDGINICEEDPCARCQRNEVCVNDVCKPTGVDLCEGIRCGLHAFCRDGACVCHPGYTGDPVVECIEERDPCENVRCHHYGICRGGKCQCVGGYTGDGYHDCRPQPRDPCEGVKCHSNAYCRDGRCICYEGFEGDGYWECKRPQALMEDPCARVQCHQHARCDGGYCRCMEGYRGDGYRDCQPLNTDACAQRRCHEYADCHDGHCQCRPGYVGDGYYECRRDPEQTTDACARVRCHEHAQCDNGQCHCRPGYVGDSYYECRQNPNLCAKAQCHPNAECVSGVCRCLPGFSGDGYQECSASYGELCAGVQCHRFAQCYQNRCYCTHGYVGDGLNFCDLHTEDPCDGVRCAANAACHQGRCSCDPGFEGDGHQECRRIQDKCANVLCHAYAQCHEGQCRCLVGYDGDGYRECRPSDMCTDQDCHPHAHCANNRCQCKAGYDGDGYTSCKRKPSVDPAQCSKCRGIPLKELAQCVDGQCVCAPGFIQAHPGVCMECVQANCHRDAVCLPTAQFNGAFSCQCKAGYHGDGVSTCSPDGTATGDAVDPTCGGGCRVRNAECNAVTGRCECRQGYDGDAQFQCVWNCQVCVADAICDRENERCSCKPGYYGDGTTYCEPIPVRPEPVEVHISGQGDVLRLADLEKPLILQCFVTTSDESITGQWVQPQSSQKAHISIGRLANGTENVLRITKPALTDAGRYYCRAGSAEAFINVVIEETAIPYDIFLTSDDGILKVRSSGQNSTVATIWNLAENNKYGRVAMVTDCNSQRVIYTSDYGHAVRWGDAHAQQKSLSTTAMFQSQLNRFRNLAVDPPSGNVFAWDEANGRLVVLNPSKPHMMYTLDTIGGFKQAEPLRFAGLTLHSSQGLIYWALFSDGWMPNGTIQVASMMGENERQLLQLTGEPLALSLSPSYDKSVNSAGRLCWIQRSLTNVFVLTTEMHCARLSSDGRSIIMQERLRQFNPSEEPSWGMVHHHGTVLWTDASRPVFYSANPARRVRVRLVCCSNRFQAIAALAKCNPAMNNACSYSNGRCRYFCLPGEDQRSRTCVCPDKEIGCHKEM